MSKSEPLLHALAKVELAETQIDQLNSRINTFFDTHPYSIVTEVNAQGTQEVWKFRLDGPPPHQIAGMVGGTMHYLRSALDNLACALAILNTGSDKGTYFPFGADANIFEKQLATKGKKLPPDAREMIRALKPYKGGNDLLWLLHDANRADKHPSLKVINVETICAFYGLFAKSGEILVLGSKTGKHMIRGPKGLVQPENDKRPMLRKRDRHYLELTYEGAKSTNEDLEFMTVTPGTQFEADFEPTLNVAFRDVEGFEREPVVAVLHQMRQLVQRALLTFEKQFFP